jgi:hypothetical protein
MTGNPNRTPETNAKTPQEISLLLGIVLTVLVIVHLTIAVAIPLLFVFDIRAMPPNVVERVFNIWLCHPLIIALCLKATERGHSKYRKSLVGDIAISILQIASVFVLYGFVDHL